jgi:hypothetical protein
MDPINKTAMRVAVLIHEQLAGGTRHDLPIYLPEYSWNNIQQLRRQIDRACERGWHRAAARLTEDLADALDNCRRELENAARVLQSGPSKRRVSSASDVYRDILALHHEFEDVNVDLNEHTLSVTTDRIVLEGMSFGRFEIKLDWQQLGSPPAYRVVALEPTPAARRDDVTHPHVQDEQLCEGEGRAAVQAALAECRLYDFFLLVSQLLHTYGKGSAYVELQNWDGIPCDDCGDSIDEDSRYYCDRCGSTLCGSCSINCHGCDNGFCSGCVSSCCRCGREFCSSCLETCPVCRKQFCEDCREAGLCHACHDKQRNEEKEDDSPENDAIQQPAARPRRSRQRNPTCVPA